MLRVISLAVLVLVATFSFAQEVPHITLPSGHADDIADLVFSNDGNFLLTSSDDGDIKLWETSSGRMLRSFSGSPSPYEISLSADNSKVIAWSSNSITIWETSSSKLLKQVSNLGAYALIGNVLLFANGNGDGSVTVIRIDLATMKELGRFSGQFETGMLFSDDGRWFAATKKVKKKLSVTVIDVSTGKEIALLPIGIEPKAFTPDGKYLQLWMIDDSGIFMSVFDIAKKKMTGNILTNAHSSTITKDGKYLLTYNGDTTTTWKMPTCERVTQFGDQSYALVSLLEDQEKLVHVYFDDDSTLFKTWNIDGTPGPSIFSTSKKDRWAGNTYSDAFGVTGNFVWSGSLDDQHLRIWDGLTGKLVVELDAGVWAGSSLDPSTRIGKITMSADGKFAAFHRGKDIELWDVAARRKKKLGVTTPVQSARFSRDRSSIIITSDDQYFRIFDAKKKKLVIPNYYAEYSREEIYATSVTDVSDTLWFGYGSYSPNASGSNFLFDPGTNKRYENFSSSHHSKAAFASNGQFFVTYPGYANEWDDGAPKLYRWPFGGRPTDINIEDASGRCFITPDDSKLLVRANGNSVLWDIASGKTNTFAGASWSVLSSPFDPSGKKLTLASNDSLRFYDVATAKQTKVMYLDNLWQVEVTPTGTVLALSYSESYRVSSLAEIDANGIIKSQRSMWPASGISNWYFNADLVSFKANDSTILWQRSTDKIFKVKGIVSDIADDGTCLVIQNGNLLVYRDWKNLSDPLTLQFVAHSADFLAYDPSGHFDLSPDTKDIAYMIEGLKIAPLKLHANMIDQQMISNWMNRKK